MAGAPPTTYAIDPTLFLYTSLTAGSSHIITATSRLETILKANKIPFRAIDVATDEKARMIWGRRSKGRKLPGLVRYGNIVGDLDQIEDWNEYGELKAQIAATLSPSDAQKSEPQTVAVAPAAALPKTASSAPHIRIGDTPSRTPSSELQGENMTSALRQASEEAAAKAKDNMRARLGLKPQSPLQKSEEQKLEDQKPEEDKPEGKKAEEEEPKKEKSEGKESEDQEPQKKEIEEQKSEKQAPKESKSDKGKPEEKRADEQPAKEDNKEKPLESEKEAAKLPVGSEATQPSEKAEEKAPTEGLPVRTMGERDETAGKSTGDSKLEKAEDEGEASAASPSETKEAKEVSGLEKGAA
ncbi:hypothetical protein FQN49_000081 [Arthroderma sp. PD_2]|nr:hypothetical protein FQN49_000081 [Arthroderma sp. PD_2]